MRPAILLCAFLAGCVATDPAKISADQAACGNDWRSLRVGMTVDEVNHCTLANIGYFNLKSSTVVGNSKIDYYSLGLGDTIKKYIVRVEDDRVTSWTSY